LQQNNIKFIAEIDKKIEKNEIQQIVTGINNKENLEEVIRKQNIPINTNNTTIVAR
jgi:hypothetical protein